MARHTVATILLLGMMTAATRAGESGEQTAFRYLGQIKARPAAEIQASNWSVGAETMDRDYTIYRHWKTYLGPLGVKKARLQAGWAKTEKNKGVYDWAWLDEIVFDMVAQKVEPWMCLSYGNPLYADGGGTLLGAAIPRTEEALQAWEKFVRAIVDRYQHAIDEWEVWNEPNLGKNNAPEIYAGFLIRTAQAVRQVQPGARILAMSLAGVDVKFTDAVLKIVTSAGELDLIDEVTYHPYSFNPDKSYDAVVKLRQFIGAYSSRITIRQGENGAPSERRNTKALSKYDWTETSQAKWALRRLLGDLGREIPSSYFSLMDMKYPDEMNRKGLLHSREDQTVERAKPAYYAVQNLAAIFDHTLCRIPNYAWRTDAAASLAVFAYENRDTGRQVVTIWQDSATPSDRLDKTAIDFTFLAGSFDRPVYVDLREGRVYEIPVSHWSRRATVCEFRG
ncbi:MAG: hypothetical protein MUC88_29065, partial [Planctomycetes bacterium]|nr:hypothetical protein [Planctomycetota bacterium]